MNCNYRLGRPAWILFLVLGVLLSVSSQARAIDIDEDGLDDAFERELIDRHRPYFHYSSGERHWPSSVTWYVQQCSLAYWDVQTLPPVWREMYSRAEVAANPGLILQGVIDEPRQFSNKARTPGITNFKLNPPNSDAVREGQGLCNVNGTYAHVVGMGGPVNYTGLDDFLYVFPGDILIQYWQFFPYNDSDSDTQLGDHDADWLYLDLYLSRDWPHDLKYVVYHHHGDGNCTPTVLPHYGPLPANGRPHVYLEDGSHEWWPDPDVLVPPFNIYASYCPCDTLVHCSRKDGLVHTCSVAENVIPNLGEAWAPMPGLEPELILFYNGKWGFDGDIGTPPPSGPALKYYPRPVRRPVVYVDGSTPQWNLGDGYGSVYHPFPELPEALNEVDDGGRVRISAGTYQGRTYIRRAMTLEVRGNGLVRIVP